MKRYIVLARPGFNPGDGIFTAFNLENFTFQLDISPLYTDFGTQTESTFSIEEDNPRLRELKDEMSRTFILQISEQHVPVMLDYLTENHFFERIEEDEENYIYTTPNDTLFSQLYGLKQIQAQEVWDQGNMGNDILVAVIDTGIDVQHQDLANNLWKDVNGNNGFNLIDGSFDLTDIAFHGTHVAGTIGAIANNNMGVAGVAPKCKIMALKALDGAEGRGNASTLANAMKFAVDHGAKVINNSWGPGRHSEIQKQIEYAHLKNVVVIFAAGNENRKLIAIDAAANSLVISVAATDKDNTKWNHSNFGEFVSVSAPGVGIMSTIPNQDYKVSDGTSMAAPHVAGLAALILCRNSSLVPAAVKSLITSHCDPVLAATVPMGAGRINALKTIAAIT